LASITLHSALKNSVKNRAASSMLDMVALLHDDRDEAMTRKQTSRRKPARSSSIDY
jgi:hypothetical protein